MKIEPELIESIIAGLISNAIWWIIALIVVGLITAIFTLKNWQRIYLYLKKQKLRFFSVDFNIALSLDFEEGLNSGHYYHQIKKNLIKLIEGAGLLDQIVLREISDIKKFANRKEAESFREQKNIDLIIWGDFSSDHLQKKGEKLNEAHLKFTYGHPNDERNILGKMVSADIHSLIAQKNYWIIFEKNSFEDVKIISDSIFEIATYIIALTLKLSGRINKSLLLFEQLYIKIKSKKKNNVAYQKVILNLYNCYELLILEHGVYGKNEALSKECCLKLLAIKEFKDDFFAIANLAKAQYCLGETAQAEILVTKLEKLYPNEPTTLVDVAYFRILQKKYKIAFQKYRKLTKFNAIHFSPEDVIEFLCKEYHNTKEPALLYGSGIISNRWWDKKLAKKHLNLFLKKSKFYQYKLMRKQAKKILKQLQSI